MAVRSTTCGRCHASRYCHCRPCRPRVVRERSTAPCRPAPRRCGRPTTAPPPPRRRRVSTPPPTASPVSWLDDQLADQRLGTRIVLLSEPEQRLLPHLD